MIVTNAQVAAYLASKTITMDGFQIKVFEEERAERIYQWLESKENKGV